MNPGLAWLLLMALAIVLCIGSGIAGWHIRGAKEKKEDAVIITDENTAKELNLYKEKYEQERTARSEAAKRFSKSFNLAVEEIGELKEKLQKAGAEILSLREANEQKNKTIEQWQSNPLKMHFTGEVVDGKSLIADSHMFNEESDLK
jgi:uncharacterized protein HemX